MLDLLFLVIVGLIIVAAFIVAKRGERSLIIQGE